MKFDVVVGNPPYQASQNATGKRGGGSSLWDKFVIKTIDYLLKENGYLCFVHPASWRKPFSQLWNKMISKQIIYLEIHSTKDGQQIFGAGTRYDWYILQNKPPENITIILDEIGNINKINLSDWPWLPNFNFNKIKNIISVNSMEENIIFNVSNYETRKKWVSETQDEKFKYHLVHSTLKDNTRWYYSSKKDNGHFGISKVIFGDSGINNPIIDIDGKYGMTQHSMAIPIQSKDDADSLCKALKSSSFSEIIAATKWSNFQIDWRMFKFFKQNWWKEFIDD
jgi:hypothetical protein